MQIFTDFSNTWIKIRKVFCYAGHANICCTIKRSKFHNLGTYDSSEGFLCTARGLFIIILSMWLIIFLSKSAWLMRNDSGCLPVNLSSNEDTKESIIQVSDVDLSVSLHLPHHNLWQFGLSDNSFRKPVHFTFYCSKEMDQSYCKKKISRCICRDI